MFTGKGALFFRKARTHLTEYTNSEYVESKRVFVDDIQLGSMKVKLNNGSYEIHPVWNFSGYTIDKYKQQEPGGGWILDENMEHKNDRVCFVTLDAITGELIRREVGY